MVDWKNDPDHSTPLDADHLTQAFDDERASERAYQSSTYARVAPVPTGVTATDTPALVAALASMTAGDRLTFRGGTYSINAPLTPPAGVTLVASRGCTISQVTQYTPAFDLFNVDNVTIGDGFTLVNASGPPPGQGSSTRGDAGYVSSAGVWANGNGITIGNLRIKDFGVGVNINSSNGTVNGDGTLRTGNRVGDLEISGCNHGVLFLEQSGLRIGNIYTHDHVDSSAGGNPMHAIYGTGTTTLFSENISVGNSLDVNNPTGAAFQFKYVHGLTLGTLTARNTGGLLNVIDSFDITGGNLSSSQDHALGGSVLFQKIANQSARIHLGAVTVDMAIDVNDSTVKLICDDVYIAGLVVTAPRNGLNTGITEVAIWGARVTIDGLKLRNTGTASCRAVLVGASGYPTQDATIRNLEVDGYRTLVDFDSTVTGVNVIDYAPAAQRRIVFGAGSYIKAISGTPPFFVVRRETVNTYSAPQAGVTYYPLAGLETISRFAIPSSAAFTVGFPQIGAYSGLTHEIAIFNNTAGALGAITWDALYQWISGSAPAAPAAGATLTRRFMYDGTHWREMG